MTIKGVNKEKSTNKLKAKQAFIIEEIQIEKGEIIEITGDMIIGDVVLAYPETLEIFKKAGIHCVGCYASTFESIQEGVAKHGLDSNKICKALNNVIQTKHSIS